MAGWEISVLHTNPMPMYQQIVDQIKQHIIQGNVKPHEALPSIREMAKLLMVSVITVKRAYQELEQQGWIYTRAGLGSFVAPVDREEVKRTTLNEISRLLATVLQKAFQAGIALEEVIAIIQHLAENGGEEK